MNYRSAMIHGNAVLVTAPQEILDGLRAIVNHNIPGRWNQVRKPTSTEIRETGIWRVPLTQASVKTRTGSTLDPDADRTLPVWAGVIPTAIILRPPVAAEGVPPGIAFSGIGMGQPRLSSPRRGVPGVAFGSNQDSGRGAAG